MCVMRSRGIRAKVCRICTAILFDSKASCHCSLLSRACKPSMIGNVTQWPFPHGIRRRPFINVAPGVLSPLPRLVAPAAPNEQNKSTVQGKARVSPRGQGTHLLQPELAWTPHLVKRSLSSSSSGAGSPLRYGRAQSSCSILQKCTLHPPTNDAYTHAHLLGPDLAGVVPEVVPVGPAASHRASLSGGPPLAAAAPCRLGPFLGGSLACNAARKDWLLDPGSAPPPEAA